MKKAILTLFGLICGFVAFGQSSLDASLRNLPDAHPRVLTTPKGKKETLQLVKNEAWAQTVLNELRQRTDKYANNGPEWLSSRLCMFWKSHATDVFIKGEYYDHAGGASAPEPTVMYNGARSHATVYGRLPIEQREPYAEHPKGILLPNNSTPNKTPEYADISKTGCQVASMNMDILNVARDAAFLYWLTDDTKYGEVAAHTFDVYMAGIFYRNVPTDLNHGHQQTLVGMSTFEVIHEDALNALVPLYDFLYDYLKTNKPNRMPLYAAAFKKWADNIIANGVPHNNWDLIQAEYIMHIALILEDDESYSDKKGRQYYIRQVLDANSIRQWGLKKLADYGFDMQTGIWAECPGYSTMVVGVFANFVNLFDRTLQIDLLQELPVIEKAVWAIPNYLFPYGYQVGWGDTHPHTIDGNTILRLIQNAQLYGKKEQERKFTAMLRLFAPDLWQRASDKKQKQARAAETQKMPVAITSFFADKPIALDKSIPAASIHEFTSPLFYAPNVSWVSLRNGMDKQHSLMASLNGSYGNHMHANGISMELYAKGLPLAPDAGIGLSLYSGQDYLEYYSQFPSHNTVCVDGISSYPVMKSDHAFSWLSGYPKSGAKEGIFKEISFANVYFREPETQADQTRLTSIINTSHETGYFVDIFRSRRAKGDDKTHDYFYHNLGQSLALTAADGSNLNLQPTDELAFAGGHLYAYSYLFNKKSVDTNRNVKATFTIQQKGEEDIKMTMWQQGEANRTVFTALSPMTEGLSRMTNMPYDIAKQPTLTFVARQKGEAWTHPFVSIFEATTVSQPSKIASVNYFKAETKAEDFAGIEVKLLDGRTDYIFSLGTGSEVAAWQDMKMSGDYAVISRTDADNFRLFLGGGTLLQCNDVCIRSNQKATIIIEKRAGKWYASSSDFCTVKVGNNVFDIPVTDYRPIDF